MIGNIPYTPRVKKVLALASKEAKALNHTYVGTEHILLGLLREGDGVAAKVLKNLDVDIEQCRQEILKELDPNFTGEESSIPPEASSGEKTVPGAEKKGDVKTPALKAFGRDLTKSRARAKWIRSSAAKMKLSASSRFSAAAPRTIRFYSAKRASARRPSSKGSRRKSRRATCRKFCATNALSRSTSR
jgi:ATP-dependent Clp protease ATP-binding subunit ClpA